MGANGNSSLLASLLQLLDLYRKVLIRNAYRESNLSADWLASFAASLPPILHDPLLVFWNGYTMRKWGFLLQTKMVVEKVKLIG